MSKKYCEDICADGDGRLLWYGTHVNIGGKIIEDTCSCDKGQGIKSRRLSEIP